MPQPGRYKPRPPSGSSVYSNFDHNIYDHLESSECPSSSSLRSSPSTSSFGSVYTKEEWYLSASKAFYCPSSRVPFGYGSWQPSRLQRSDGSWSMLSQHADEPTNADTISTNFHELGLVESQFQEPLSSQEASIQPLVREMSPQLTTLQLNVSPLNVANVVKDPLPVKQTRFGNVLSGPIRPEIALACLTNATASLFSQNPEVRIRNRMKILKSSMSINIPLMLETRNIKMAHMLSAQITDDFQYIASHCRSIGKGELDRYTKLISSWMESIARVIKKNPDLSVPKFSKKNYKKEGFCYLRLFPRKHRAQAQVVLRNHPSSYSVNVMLYHFGSNDFTRCSFNQATSEFHVSPSDHKRLGSMILGTGTVASNGIENGLNVIGNSVHKDGVVSEYVGEVTDSIREAQVICPYAVPPTLRKLLSDKGIPVDHNASRSHPHPAHKAIENLFLNRLLDHHLVGPTTCMFMRPHKFNTCRNRNPLFSNLENVSLTIRDKSRWPGSSEYWPASIDSENVFMHNAGHFLGPREISAFFSRYPNVNDLMFTAVLPPELLCDRPSFFPKLYTLSRKDDDTYIYHLEGNNSSYYVQPMSSLTWLTCSSIQVEHDGHNKMTLGVSLLESRFAHHLFRVTRGNPRFNEEWRSFDSPREVKLPTVRGINFNTSNPYIPFEVYRNVFLHSNSLTTKRLESTLAKVRTYASNEAYDHIESDVWTATANVIYALAAAENSPLVESFQGGLTVSLKRFFLEKLAPFLRKYSFEAFLAGVLAETLDLSIVGWSTFGLKTLLASLQAHNLSYVAACLFVYSLAFSGPNPGDDIQSLVDRHPKSIPLSFKMGVVSVVTNGSHLWNAAHNNIYAEGPINSSYEKKSRSESDDTMRTLDSWLDDIFKCDDSSVPNSPKANQSNDSISSINTSSEPGPEAGSVIPPISSQLKFVPPKLPSDASSSKSVKEVSNLRENNANLMEADPFHHQNITNFTIPEAKEFPASSDARFQLREMYGLSEDEVYENDGYAISFGANNRVFPYPRQACLLDAMSNLLSIPRSVLWTDVNQFLPIESLSGPIVDEQGLDATCLVAIAYKYRIQIELVGDVSSDQPHFLGLTNPARDVLELDKVVIHYRPGHWSAYDDTSRGLRQTYTALDASSASPDGIYQKSTNTSRMLQRHISENSSDTLSFKVYLSRPRHAKSYIRDLKNGKTGTLLRRENKGIPDQFTSKLDASVDSAKPRRVGISFIAGLPGSNKSFPIKQALLSDKSQYHKNNWQVSVPTVQQRQTWSNDLQLGKYSGKVSTFENAILKSADLLVIDEVSQMPPGYVDLCIVSNPRLSHIVLLGDFVQGNQHEPNPEATIRDVMNEARYFRRFTSCYKGYSYTIFRELARKYGVNTLSEEEGFIRYRPSPSQNLPLLVASQVEVNMYSDLGYDVKTFQAAQGDRYHKPVQIIISPSADRFCDAGLIFSAACRSTKGVYYIFSTTASGRHGAGSNPNLAPLLDSKSFGNYKKMFSKRLIGQRIIDSPAQAIRGGNVHWEPPIDRATVQMGAYLSGNVEPVFNYVSDGKSFESGPNTHLPLDNEVFVRESFGELPIRETREKYINGEQSTQFDDANMFSQETKYNDDEQMFPRQKGSDKVTAQAAVEKRLRFENRASNLSDVKSKKHLGPILLESFLNTMSMPKEAQPFDELLYASCIAENEFTKLTSKTQATIRNNVDRADPDWRSTFVRIFVKGQLKTKMGSIMSDFKAGQTLASFQDSVILITGPMTRYLVHTINKLKGDNVYLHNGRSSLQLSSFCSSKWKDFERHTTNDYSEYDLSQRGEALAMEMKLLEYAKIPSEVCDYYFNLKISMRCQYGDLAILRHTGEGPTLLFNTNFNIAVAGIQYDLSHKPACCFAGDDLAICGTPLVRKEWSAFKKNLTLIAKTVTPKTADFCSWYLTSKGCIKIPTIVLLKLRIAKSRGELKQVVDNYASEVAVGYQLGDHLYDYLDEVDMASQAILVRFFVTSLSRRFAWMFTRLDLAHFIRKLGYDQIASEKKALAIETNVLWMLDSSVLRHITALSYNENLIRV